MGAHCSRPRSDGCPRYDQRDDRHEVVPFVFDTRREDLIIEKLFSFGNADGADDFKEQKAEIFKVTEPIWTHAFVKEIEELQPEDDEEKAEKFKFLITDDWILPHQKNMMQGLLQEITRKTNGAVEFVRVASSDLEKQINNAINNESIKPSHMAVFGKDKAVPRLLKVSFCNYPV